MTDKSNPHENQPRKKKPAWLKIAAALALLLALGAAWQYGLKDYFSLESVQASAREFKTFVQDHLVLGMLAFTAFYITALCLLMPIAAILMLTSGFLFGMIPGALLALFSGGCSATIIFLLARSALGQALRDRAGPFYKAAEKEMKDGAVSYMLFMRLVPVFPFALVNIIPALFNVRLRTFLLTTIVGIAPVTFIYTNLGETLGSLQSMKDLFSPKLALAFGLLGLLALTPIVLKKVKARKT